MTSVDQPFKVLMTCGAFEPGFRRGGPIKSATHIVDTVSESVDLKVVVSDRDEGDVEPYPGLTGTWVPRGRSRIYYLNHRKFGHWLQLLREARRDHFDLLYLNSFWETVFTLPPVLAARLGLLRSKVILLAPRGELAPGAMALKAKKKAIYLKTFSLLLRSMNVVWHASTELEAQHIRASIPWARIIVNANQAAFPAEPRSPKMSQLDHPRLVFLSRINPTKNLLVLLSALNDLKARIDLDIYGPIYDLEYWAECQRVIDVLPHNVCVRYLGEVEPHRVRDVFSEYDAFVLPTRGENFGHVIAESLSASCPVLCPDTTPWTPELRAGGGVVLEGDLEKAIVSALTELATASPVARLNARRKAAEAYKDWHERSDQMNVIDAVRQEIQELRLNA